MREVVVHQGERKGWVELAFAYDPELVAVVRALRERRWDAEHMRWHVPVSHMDALVAELRRRGVRVRSTGARGSVASLANAHPAPGAGGVADAGEADTRDATTGEADVVASGHGGEGVCDRADAELRLRAYSERTRYAYMKVIRRFVADMDGAAVTSEGMRGRLLDRVDSGVSNGYHGQLVAALRFLGVHVIRGDFSTVSIPTVRRGRSLPAVLSADEVRRLLAQLRNPGHRLMVLLMYSSGVRVGELVRLKVNDLDRDRRLIRVRRGKGHKDRYTLYSDSVADTLELYLRLRGGAGEFIFAGRSPSHPITARTVQHVVAAAGKRARIAKAVTPHTLRHSFATHLLEQGVDLRYIQELLGHASSRTTEVYTHVTQRDLVRIRSPLDTLGLTE